MDVLGDLVGEKVVDLSDMTDRVLARGCFRAGWTVERYYSVDSVSSAHLAAVAVVCRGSEDSQVYASHSSSPFVQSVDVNIHPVKFHSRFHEARYVFDDLGLALEVLILVFDKSVNKGHGDCKVQISTLPRTHNLDVLASFREFFLETGRVDVSFCVKDDSLCISEWCVADCC